MTGNRVGYTGGTTRDPTYKSVCAGDGHSEAIKIVYDPSMISYQRLLAIFWKEHNPTRRARTQYRSAIFYHNEEQRKMAEAMREEIERQRGVCFTATEPAQDWYDAEEYHQHYLKKRQG